MTKMKRYGAAVTLAVGLVLSSTACASQVAGTPTKGAEIVQNERHPEKLNVRTRVQEHRNGTSSSDPGEATG